MLTLDFNFCELVCLCLMQIGMINTGLQSISHLRTLSTHALTAATVDLYCIIENITSKQVRLVKP